MWQETASGVDYKFEHSPCAQTCSRRRWTLCVWSMSLPLGQAPCNCCTCTMGAREEKRERLLLLLLLFTCHRRLKCVRGCTSNHASRLAARVTSLPIIHGAPPHKHFVDTESVPLMSLLPSLPVRLNFESPLFSVSSVSRPLSFVWFSQTSTDRPDRRQTMNWQSRTRTSVPSIAGGRRLPF